MSDDEHQEMKAKAMRTSKIMVIIGLVGLVTGIVLYIVGFTIDTFIIAPLVIGGFLLVISFGVLAFGLQIRFAANAGKYARYMARETAPAANIMMKKTAPGMKTAAGAVAEGIAEGLGKEGMSLGGKEVVKIKCRNCGYLETEDAEYCSKCGQVM
jgi:hypothetical protein